MSEEKLNQKVMAALAGGRWVVTRRFVDRSHRQVGVHSHLGFLWLVILVSIDCFGVVFVVKLVFLLINVLYLCHTCISIAQGYWLSSPKPFVVNDAVLQHRLQVLQAGLFHFLSSNFKSSLRSSRRSFLGISCSSPPFRPEEEWSVQQGEASCK